jgi:beta-lactamase regulating signal transducer with metallopeptidase domain
MWQAALIGLGVALGKRLLRDHEASWRYGLSCVGLLVMALVAAVTALTLIASDQTAAPFSLPVTWIESQLQWIYVAWMMGVTGLSLRLAGGWFLIYRLKRLASPVHLGLQARVEVLRTSLGVKRPVRVFRSALVRVPIVVGWFKPVILIPGSLLTGIPAAELEALLSHELGHIRRYDYLVNGLQSLIETLFFFHPAVWWVSRQIRVEREHCCDDLALTTADKLTYSRALLELEESKGAGLTFNFNGVGVGADGGHLLSRIRRLAASPESSGSYVVKLVSTFALTIMLLGSVHMSEARRAPMIALASAVSSLDVSFRIFQRHLRSDLDVPEVSFSGSLPVTPVASESMPKSVVADQVRKAGPGVDIVASVGNEPRESVEPAPPVARSRRDGVWNANGLPSFLTTSTASAAGSSSQSGRRIGFGLSGGAIKSSSIGPLSPNVEIRGLITLDALTQIEVGVGFSMFFHENLFAYNDAKGEQIQMLTNYEQQFQISLGIRRTAVENSLSGVYYGLAGGVMRLPIHRLIGDADGTQEAYDSKTGYFFLPKIGYVTRTNASFSWDLSAGLSFSRSHGVAFVQPVVSLGLNYWK